MMRLSTYTSLAYQPTRQSLEEEGENQFFVFLLCAGFLHVGWWHAKGDAKRNYVILEMKLPVG